jgi:hypothetical protein
MGGYASHSGGPYFIGAKVRMGLETSFGVLDLQALELRHSFKNRLVLRLCIAHPFAL